MTKTDTIIPKKERYCQHCNEPLIEGEFFTCSKCGKHSCHYCDHPGSNLENFRCSKCDIIIALEKDNSNSSIKPITKFVEAELDAKDIRKLKKEGKLIKQLFLNTLIIKYKKNKYTSKKNKKKDD